MLTSIAQILYKPHTLLIKPIYNSVLELLHLIGENFQLIIKTLAISLLAFGLISSFGYYRLALWCMRWIGLGILSSVGFGFGMHTFVLFLAPHIAAVTLASHSCKSLDFPEPPYPNEIICPDYETFEQVTFVNIIQKVGLESFMWGLGTAIGELPPYLAARLRANTIRRNSGDTSGQVYEAAGWERWMIRIITKAGFIGILLCAAIPNPLFDAAGVASGVAQIPFLTFFGATFMGKAIIKVLLQSSFVILLFHNNNLDLLISHVDKKLIELLPAFKDLNLHQSVAIFISDQRTNVLRKQSNELKQPSMIGSLFNWLIFTIMILFVLSLVHALDTRYRERKQSKSTRKTE